jgi:class 3 adenylate cyclase
MAGTDGGHAMAESDAAAGGLERKLATILSADIAAYSRLMAEDEERTLQTFRGHKEVFEKLVELHRGRVFNTAGDAILAEFSSAVEAVRCATEIQATLRTRNDQLASERQVNFRIGVNLGDVMVQGGFAWRRRQCRGPLTSGGRARRYLHFRQRVRPGA